MNTASSLPEAKALPALIELADSSQLKLTDTQKSAALKQAVTIARRLKDYTKADELTARIPIEAERKTAEMFNLIAQRDPQKVIEKFGGEDLTKWPFWAAGKAYFARGRAYAMVKDKVKAEADLRAALELISDKRERKKIAESLGKITGGD